MLEGFLKSFIAKEFTRRTMDTLTFNRYFIIKSLWYDLERLNNRKKDVYNYGDLSYHLLLSFEWRLYHGMKGGKLVWWIRWKGGLKVMVSFLAMYGGG